MTAQASIDINSFMMRIIGEHAVRGQTGRTPPAHAPPSIARQPASSDRTVSTSFWSGASATGSDTATL